MRRFLRLHPDAAGGGGPAAPAAAPASAPAAPEQSIFAPPATPIQLAMDEARSRMAAGQPITGIPAEPAPAEQLRADDGTFAKPEGEAPAETPDTPVTEGSDSAAPEGKEANPLLVEIPGRREGDEPDSIIANSPEQAERFRQLVNGYQRADVLQRQEFRIREDRRALSEISARLELDPEGFMFEQIPKERAASVALQVLLQPEVWDNVNDVLMELLESDDKREMVRVTLENTRLKNKEQVSTQMAMQREAAVNANQVKQAIAMMIPETLPEADQIALYQACQQDVVAYAERMGLNILDPRDVPLVVASRLRSGGVDPVQAAAIFHRAAPEKTLTPKGPARGMAPRAPARPAANGQPSGKDFVAAAAAAARGATTAPAGAGGVSAAGTGQPPAGQTLEERIKWSRDNLRFATGA